MGDEELELEIRKTLRRAEIYSLKANEKIAEARKQGIYKGRESNWPSPFGSTIGPPSSWSFPTKDLTCPKCGSTNFTE